MNIALMAGAARSLAMLRRQQIDRIHPGTYTYGRLARARTGLSRFYPAVATVSVYPGGAMGQIVPLAPDIDPPDEVHWAVILREAP